MSERDRSTALSVRAPRGFAQRRTLKHLLLDIRKGFQQTVEAHEIFKAKRIKLGLDLLEARTRIEAGEAGDGVRWWEWFEKNFPQSRSDAERVMAIASAENPQAAYEAAKAKNAAHNRAYRQRQRQGQLSISREVETPPLAPVAAERVEVLPPSPSPSEERQIEEIAELFKRLPRGAQVRCALRLRKIMRGEA
jgi:hypothetical protein